MMKLEDFRLVVTAGPTREWLDPVRFITNASSGKTGWHIASLGLKRFREVVYISGPGDPRYAKVEGARCLRVDSTEDMSRAVNENTGDDTVLIMTAAPADYTPANVAENKIKKSPEGLLRLELRPTTDILKTLSEHTADARNCIKVGFAAETNDLEANAQGKLERKGLHFICANQVYRDSAGFGDNDNTWRVFGRDGSETVLGPAPKEDLAGMLLDLLAREI